MMRTPLPRGRVARPCMLMLVLVLALTLGACGAESDSEGGSATAAADGDVGAGKSVSLEQLPRGTAELCGDEPVKLAEVDGVGANSWRKTNRAELADEFKDCPNVEISYHGADGDIQKYNTIINSLVAQGYDAIVTFDPFGPQSLPALRNAYKAGVEVVPYISPPGGVDGEDYTAFLDHDRERMGRMWVEWLDKVLKGKGSLLFMGGVPGNPSSLSYLAGVKENAKKLAPRLSFLSDQPVDTNWDPAQYQRVTSGLISKYPQIDAFVSDLGAAAVGQVRGYVNAGKPHPALAAVASDNELGCLWREHKADWPSFQILSLDGTTRMVRWAGRRAVAAANDVPLADPKLINTYAFIDTTAGKAPKCVADLPPDADLSSGLSPQALKRLLG